MADIIRLNDDPHAQTQHLLPWYVTGALEGKDLAQVEQHLLECAECREDAEIEKALAHHVRGLPCDVERGWATLKARIEGAPGVQRETSLFSRRIPLGWALAAQAAVLAAVVSIMAFAPPRLPLAGRTGGATPGAGDLVVVFRPDASEAALRAILIRNQARIVDGPTASDAYVLRVEPGRHAVVRTRLQDDPNVALVQPLYRADR
jgi:hypothetical protein